MSELNNSTSSISSQDTESSESPRKFSECESANEDYDASRLEILNKIDGQFNLF
jgi:hypothetical protein